MVNVYSLAMDGNKHISKNFLVREYRSRDGADPIFVDPQLVELVQRIRDHFGKPLTITSAYRTPAHNRNVGGAKHSQHLYGTAADIQVQGIRPSSVADYVETLMPDRGGIGRYRNFTHVDVRTTKARWNG